MSGQAALRKERDIQREATRGRPCRLCGETLLAQSDMQAQLDAYLDVLPEELLVADVDYVSRLALCADCVHQRAGTCGLCGCFVRSRAAKWKMACPATPNPRWGVGRPRMGEA